MSKKTQKKASKPKVRARTATKARTPAGKAAGTVSKARAKVKTKPSAAGARKAVTGKRASTATRSTLKTTPATKAVPKARAPATTRIANPKVAQPSSTGPARTVAAPERASNGLAIGSKVPPFNLPRDGGATVSLDSFAGRKLVIFFYPRASTPGCTKEAMDFSRLRDAFAALDTAVVGVSADPQRAQETFRDKHDLTVPLLSDETHAVLNDFGVWGDKSLYGKIFQGIIRTTVLVGPDARVIHIWRNVKVDGHAETVLNYIENL